MMNLVNRLIVVLGILVLVLFAVMLIVLAWAYSDETINKLGDFVTYLSDRETDGTRVIITLIAGFVVLVGLSFLVLELAPRRQRTVTVRDVETGSAVLSTDAMARRLEDIVSSMPEVEATRAKVEGKNRAVDVDLQVMVDPECDLSAVASEVSRTVQEVVTQQMRVALAKPPRLQLYYSYGAQAGARTQKGAAGGGKTQARRARVVPGAVEGEGQQQERPVGEEPQSKGGS